MPSNLSPSHFNSGMTSTASPRPPSAEEPGLVPPPPSPPPSVEVRRSSSARRGLALVVIAALAVLLVAVAFETGVLAPGGGGTAGPAVNSSSNPFTGEQLYSAYASNQSKAEASYTNRTVYIQDSLDFGAILNVNTGQYYSSVDSGAVVLYWSSQAAVNQLYPGAMVLAKCSVEGVQPSISEGSVLYLQDCDLISLQSQSVTSSVSISEANV